MAVRRYLILLTLVAVQVSLAQEPKLVILPESILKAVGQGVYVACTAEVDDADLVTEMSWTAPDGRRIINNNDEPVSTDEDGTSAKLDLIINKLREQDVGEYTCSATYAGNQKLEAKIMVESFMDIDFGDTPTHQTLLIGKEGKIKCTPMAKPAPQVDWYKNMEPLKNDDDHIIQQDGILITKVTEADEGTYRCRARVVALGSIKHTEIQVEVNIPPVIDRPPQNITGKEHEEATFECGAIGKPAPVYSWVDKDNRPLENGEEFHVNSETGVLHMMNLKPEQSGEYRCTATNAAGEDFKTAFLQVYTKPKVEEFLNLTVPVGSDLEMECVVTGSPAPQVIFKKESEPKNFTEGINQDDRIIVQKRKDDRGRDVGILQIRGVSRSDDGLYTCTAESKGGVTQRWGHITVEFSPTFEDQGNTVQWSWEKAPVNLTCLATSIPNATIQWYLHNEEIDVNDINVERLSIGPLGVLRVNPVSSSYFGYYTCKASNTLGTATLDIELKEAHAPGPITSSKVDKKTATTITWKLVDPADNGGLEIQSYVVEYRLNDESWENAMRKTWIKGSTYTIDELRPLATYVFRFAARSRVGDGQWGGEKSEEMPGHAEPEEPVIFDASEVVEIPYFSHYELQWAVPLDNGKEIDYFQIVYYQVREKEGQWEAVGEKTTREVEYPGSSSYKIEGLHSDSYYKIELRAHNEIGFSTPAEAIIKTAHGRDGGAVSEETGPNIGIIVAIIIVILVVAVVVDVTCYFTRNAGITAAIKGKRGSKDKDKETMLEDGKNASDDKHEGNGQMKTQKDDLKPEQQNSDKKESSEPTETTPMIQGHALQGITKDPQHWKAIRVLDRKEVSQPSLRPTQHSSFEMLYDDISRTEAIQPTKPVIVEFHKKNMKEENAHPLSIMRNDIFSPTVGSSVKNGRSSPLLDQSYSDESLYAKPIDVSMPKENSSSHVPHLTQNQEVLSDMIEGNSPARYSEEHPFLHKTFKAQPITMGMEDITHDRSETPQYRSSQEELSRSFQTFGSREMLHQEASSQASPRSYHTSRGREALNQASPWPNNVLKNSEKQNDELKMQSLMSNSREILNDPSRFPLSNFNLSRPQKTPSIDSCSTHYQPTDAMLQQPMAQTAYKIAPYDDPGSPAKPLQQNLTKALEGQEKDALQNLKLPPSNKGMKSPYMKGTQVQMPKRNNKWSIPSPPPRVSVLTTKGEEKKPLKEVTKAHPRDTLQYSGYSFSMDNLDSSLDSHQPSSSELWSFHHPLPTTKSLNNLLDDSSISLRSYGKPTLL